MLHGNAVRVTSPVPETFQKRETPGNASETFLENRKRFTMTENACNQARRPTVKFTQVHLIPPFAAPVLRKLERQPRSKTNEAQ
ncbi:hypothetical protein Tco_0956506 [Tanacetum coccineum]